MSDKYEGHNISKVSDYQCGTATIDERKANWNLIQDAPLLLAKVKRLDEMLSLAHEWVASNLGDDMELEAFLAYIDIGGEEE